MSLVGMGSYLGFSDLGCGCLSGEMEVTEVLSRRVTCSDFFLFFFFFLRITCLITVLRSYSTTLQGKVEAEKTPGRLS